MSSIHSNTTEKSDIENQEIHEVESEKPQSPIFSSENDPTANTQSLFLQKGLPTKAKLKSLEKGGLWSDEPYELEINQVQSSSKNVTVKEENKKQKEKTNKKKETDREVFESLVKNPLNLDTPEGLNKTVEKILQTRDFALDTLNKRLDEAYELACTNKILLEEHERTIERLTSFEKDLNFLNQETSRQIESLKQRMEYSEKQVALVKTEFFEHLKSAPLAIEKAHIALENMMKMVEESGMLPPKEAYEVKQDLVEKSEALGHSLQDARRTREQSMHSKKVPLHLRKYLK